MPRGVPDAIRSGLLGPWAAEGGGAWEQWLAEIECFRAGLARLLGGSAADYCPQANVSSGLVKLLPALARLDARRRVIVAAEDSFPSIGFVLAQAERFGIRLRLLPSARNPADCAVWREALGTDTLAAVVTHVHAVSGKVAPVTEIAAHCAERGIFCVLDAAQSAGIVPFSVETCGASIVLGSCVKWLCGGPGAGFMWVHPQLVSRLEPVDVGWFSHADPFEFDIRSFEYAPDSRRFWGGTPSIAPFVVANTALGVLGELGVPAIWEHSRRLLELFGRESQIGSRAPDLAGIGGALCISLGTEFSNVAETLRAAGVRFDSRGSVVRISFHIYNSEDDAVRAAHGVRTGLRRH